MEKFVGFILFFVMLISSMMLVLFFAAAVYSMNETTKKTAACKNKGGVAITERGNFKACAKPDSYILLESDK